MDLALHRLLVKAGIAGSAYTRELWFGGCRLDRNQLVCPDLQTASCIERCFLEDLRRVMSDIQVRTEIGLSTQRDCPEVFKAPPKRAWAGELAKARQGDML